MTRLKDMQEKTSFGISEELLHFIEALVEEVVLEGKPFEHHKKYLCRFCEAESIDYDAFEGNLTEFFDIINEWKCHHTKAGYAMTKLLGKNCYLSASVIDQLFANIEAAEEASNHIAREKTEQKEAVEDAHHTGEAEDDKGGETEKKPSKLPLRIVNGTVFCTDTAIKGSLEIPSMIDGHRVTIIGKESFKGCHYLTSVVIPDSVTTIRNAAFERCNDLLSVVIPDSVKEIGPSAFKNCSNLTTVVIPNKVTTIRNAAFEGCYDLTSVALPDSVKEIGPSAFKNCSNLTSVVIPNQVTIIRNATFSGCSQLTSVSIPNSVTEIEERAFADCRKLTSVDVPNSLKRMEKRFFLIV